MEHKKIDKTKKGELERTMQSDNFEPKKIGKTKKGELERTMASEADD